MLLQIGRQVRGELEVAIEERLCGLQHREQHRIATELHIPAQKTMMKIMHTYIHIYIHTYIHILRSC
jgi:hypothetical protein